MKNPAYEHYDEEPEKPKTETVPKAIKKSFINWVVPTFCVALGLAFFTLGKSWADDRYTQKSTFDIQNSQTFKSLDDERIKREALEIQQREMNRKLDLIIYILQHNNKIDPNILNQP